MSTVIDRLGTDAGSLLEHRFQMRDRVTETDWASLAELDQTLLESWQREPGS